MSEEYVNAVVRLLWEELMSKGYINAADVRQLVGEWMSEEYVKGPTSALNRCNVTWLASWEIISPAVDRNRDDLYNKV